MEKSIPEAKSPFATEPIWRLIAKFAIPCVISLLVNSLYNIVDQIFIGWGVGYLGNGATNVVFPITIVALALSLIYERKQLYDTEVKLHLLKNDEKELGYEA